MMRNRFAPFTVRWIWVSIRSRARPSTAWGTARRSSARALHALQDRPLVATKCERCWDEQGRIIPRLEKESIRAEAEASLRQLGVEVLDLYQIHWPQPDEDIEEGWEAIADLIRAGKVRYGGVSNFSLSQLQRIQSIHPVASLQPPYSMLARGVETDLLPYCATQGIGCDRLQYHAKGPAHR